jgi:hypothetical protein
MVDVSFTPRAGNVADAGRQAPGQRVQDPLHRGRPQPVAAGAVEAGRRPRRVGCR